MANGIVRGLTKGLIGFRRGEQEAEELRRQAERDALQRSVMEFNLEASKGRERRAEAGEARTRQKETREEFDALRRQKRNEAVAEALEAAGLPKPIAELARGGDVRGGDLVRLLRPGGENGGVTPTTRFSQQAQAFRGLVDTAKRRAVTRWRQMTTGPLGSLRAPKGPDGQPITLAQLEGEEFERLERERKLQPGTLARAEVSLASSGEFELEPAPPEEPEPVSPDLNVAQRADELVQGRLRQPPRPSAGPASSPTPAPAQPAAAPLDRPGVPLAAPAGEEPPPISETDILALQSGYRGKDPDAVREILRSLGINEADIEKVVAGI